MNIFSKASKGFLAFVRTSRVPEVISCAADTVPVMDKDGFLQGGLPDGFFLAEYPNRTLLCYHDRPSGQQWWGVSDPFVHPLTKQVIKLTAPRRALKVFRMKVRTRWRTAWRASASIWSWTPTKNPGCGMASSAMRWRIIRGRNTLLT